MNTYEKFQAATHIFLADEAMFCLHQNVFKYRSVCN